MVHSVIRKLEIDVMQSTELDEAMELSHRYRMPAIVVHPDLATEANVARARKQAKCSIITPIDWPKGESYGMAKMQNMSVAALSQDGFEILVSCDNESKVKQEITTLINFIREHLPEAVEIRLVLGALSRERDEIATICDVLKYVPAPDIVRTDHNLRVQQAKANPQANAELVEFIRTKTSRPIKLSGNISSVKALAGCEVDRYAVSLKQAQAIIKEMIQQPDRSQKLLSHNE